MSDPLADRTADANLELLTSWRRALHDKSPRTVKLYREILDRFAAWLAASGRPDGAAGDLLAVSRRDADAWLAGQRDAGLSSSTIRSRWIALRSFYRWLVEEEELDESPMAKIKVERALPPPIPVLTDAQVDGLLAECAGKSFTDRRDLAMFRLMLATGLRRAEVVGLTVADVDFDRRVVFVAAGKGDRARFSRFDAATGVAIERYLRVRARHRFADRPNLWLSHMGCVTIKGLSTILAERSRKAGTGHLHPHQLRHSWADRMKRGGLSDEVVMSLGGWTDSKVMRRYGDALAVERALAAYDDAGLLDGGRRR